MNLIRTTPGWLLIVCILAAPLAWGVIGRRVASADRRQLVNKVLLAVWIVLLLYGALFSRWNMDLTARPWDLVPFRNFNAYKVKEIYLNIAMFEPLGMTLPVLLKERRSLIKVVIYGLTTSLIIEILQQVFVLGAFQMDDVIWNAVGCIIGCTFCHI